MLLKPMITYFWKIIRLRFISWVVLIILVSLGLALQYSGNPHITIITLFFSGTSYLELTTHHVSFPILWLTYFIIPCFFILNSTKELYKKYICQLRGLQFSNAEIHWNSLIAMLFFTFIYTLITFNWFLLITQIWFKSDLFSISFNEIKEYVLFVFVIMMGLFSIVLIQSLFNLFNNTLGIIVPIVILLFTAFSTWKLNPFSGLMTLRHLDNPFSNTLIGFCLIDILSISLIFFTIRRKDLI